MPVGFSAGTFGGASGNGICTFVYLGMSYPSIVQRLGTVTTSQPRAFASAPGASSGAATSRNSQSPSRERTSAGGRSSVACGGSRLRLVSSGDSQLLAPPGWRSEASAAAVIRELPSPPALLGGTGRPPRAPLG